MKKLISAGINLFGEVCFWLLIFAMTFINLPAVLAIVIAALLHWRLDIHERAVVGIVAVGCGLWIWWLIFLVGVIPK